ncbi:RAMP superfamily CRISPR-associated protein [Desulfobulbus propionicus]
MWRIELAVDLTLQAPFLTQSTAPGAYGLDAVLARDHQGRIMVPGTLLVGRLRQAWEELRSVVGDACATDVPTKDEIRDLLGVESAEGEFQPSRKRLNCTDFLFNGVEPGTAIRNRIAMDDEMGAAEQRQLMALESPFASGRTLVFSGLMRFDAGDVSKAEIIRGQILCGLQWIAQLGAFRSIGFGRVVDVTVHALLKHEIKVQQRPLQSACGLDMICMPEAPFCLADRPKAGNIFTSLEEIPGNVLKGCVAETLRRLETDSTKGNFPFTMLKASFSRLRFSHAFPSNICLTRPVRPPLSLVKSKGLYDVALLDGPALINGQAPEFSVDWKKTDDVQTLFGWPALRREMRVRTAIDREKLRNQDEDLFAYEMVVPDGKRWLARIDASDIEERNRDQVLRELSGLLCPGLLGLGKSKVAVRVKVVEEGTFHSAQPQDEAVNLDTMKGFLVLTLQTPALLLDPAAMVGQTDRTTLQQEYQAAWTALSGELLTLERFFAQQTLAGGRYQHGRFQQNQVYRPWLLTTAGSVFVFSFKAEDKSRVQEKVKTWRRRGLDLPPAVIKCYLPKKKAKTGAEKDAVETIWQHCPFIPQNGFGEIAVNLEIHDTWRPKGEEVPIENIIKLEECDVNQQ